MACTSSLGRRCMSHMQTQPRGSFGLGECYDPIERGVLFSGRLRSMEAKACCNAQPLPPRPAIPPVLAAARPWHVHGTLTCEVSSPSSVIHTHGG